MTSAVAKNLGFRLSSIGNKGCIFKSPRISLVVDGGFQMSGCEYERALDTLRIYED